MGRFFYRRPQPTGKFYRINQYIQAPKLRLIGPDGKQIGIVSKWEALQKARDFGVDLVEVSSSAKPPVCKIIDFKKFKYQEAKKEKEAKKAHQQELKEVRFGVFTARADQEVRIKRIRGFLTHGDKVKITIVFKGREITRKEFGFTLLNKITNSLIDVAKIDKPGQFMGKKLIAIFSPLN